MQLPVFRPLGYHHLPRPPLRPADEPICPENCGSDLVLVSMLCYVLGPKEVVVASVSQLADV